MESEHLRMILAERSPDAFKWLAILLVTISCSELPIQPDLDTRNKILFTSGRSGEQQLYMMNPDGSDIRQLTFGPYWHANGRWSPDGKSIVCNTEEGSNTAADAIVVLGIDGSRQIIGYGNLMAWTPDGSRIVYLGPFGPASGQYSVNSDGTNKVLLTQEFGGQAAFSPDGRRMAMATNDTSQDPPSPVVTLMDFPGLSNRVHIGPRGAFYPEWSPNGQMIAFSSKQDSMDYSEIFVVDSAGVSTRRVTVHSSPEQFYYPRWSPNGTQLIFTSSLTDGTGRRMLNIVNVDGTAMRTLIADSSVSFSDWSR